METVEIDDIKVAAFILSRGIPLVDVIQKSPHHFVFILSNPKECELLKRKYLNGGLADAQKLFMKRELLISEIKNKSRL